MNKKNLRKVTKVLLSLIIILCVIFMINLETVKATSEGEGKVTILPEKSSQFEEWESLSDSEREETIQPAYYTTDIKSSIKRSTYNTYIQLLQASESGTSSSYFNLKYNITINVKNQQKTGSCWAFSFTSVLETTMANKYSIADTEYSSMHMDYVTSILYNKEIGTGGNAYLALAYSISGYGPVDESDFTFESVYDEENNSSSSYYLTDIDNVDLEQAVQLRVDDATIYPSIYKTISSDSITYYGTETYTETQVEAIRELIKEGIETNGAVSAILSYSTTIGSSIYYNEDTYAFYNNSSSAVANHAVTIIGWDDDFSASNFNDDYQPLNDGAWIVLNSWGEDYGDEGIFYVSYDDVCIEQSIVGINSITDIEDDISEIYDNLYEYDELGMNYCVYAVNEDSSAYLTSAYVANVYSRESSDDEDEFINEIGIYLMDTEGVEIYVNVASDDLTDLELVASYTGSNALTAGYHTIQLSTPIELTGEKFVVAVKYINSEKVMIPLECNLVDSGFTTVSNVFDTASSNEGESFYSRDGETWEDIYNYSISDTITLVNTNYCVKAFTITQEASSSDVAVTGISLDEEELELEVDETANIIATITPTDATNKNVIWTSSDESVVTVTSTGVITAVAEGTATITVTTEDGNYTATCVVTVTEKTSSDDNVYTDDDGDDDDDESDTSSLTTNTSSSSTTSTTSSSTSSTTNSSSSSTTTLPYTGAVSIAFAMIGLIVVAVVTKYKYSKYKDVK